MKSFFLSINLFICSFLLAQIDSKITNVTVYLEGAQITREATINLKSGTSILNFNQLSPKIDESSIQLSGLNQTSILGVKFGINYLSEPTKTDSINNLENELEYLTTKITSQEHLISGYNEEISLIQKNKNLSNENQLVSLEKLKAFGTYYRERITMLKSNIEKSNLLIREYKFQINRINRQLTQFNKNEKIQTGEINLKLYADKAVQLKLKLTYNISDAGWFPIYDLKAKKIDDYLNLEYKAHVYQNSGCQWNDVTLKLSTSDPNTNNEKPTVNPKYLNFINPNQYYKTKRATRSYSSKYNPTIKRVSGVVTTASDGLPLPGANIIVKGTSNGVQTDFDGKYSIDIEEGSVLVFSYIGMKTEEIPISSSIMNIAFDSDYALDEVVVVGYSGSQSYKNETKPISSEEIVNSLYGKASGIAVRGASTVNSKNNLLYIVDGIPVKAKDAKLINPNSIDSINVLKDASATAVYGSRASNGVLLITTQNFKNDKVYDLGILISTGINNTTFKIKDNHTIPSDGDITVIEIDRINIPAQYEYFTAPVLNENVFLTAKIGNWESYNLLPAEANIYFEGNYSGKTNINPFATTDSLTISLGIDPNIVVKRTQINDYKKTTFIGNNKVVYKAYDIALKNNKNTEIVVTVIDRIPLSQNKTIKIDDIEFKNANFNKDKGLLKWKISLKSSESESLKHSYSIKYPKYKRINM